MKAFFNDYFHVSEQEKVREKVMLARAAVSVVFIIICLAAMCVSAYAYFTHDISSGMNIIKSADFDVEISIANATVNSNGRVRYAVLEAGKTYSVTLKRVNNEKSAKMGFVIISAVDPLNKLAFASAEKYHTEQLGVNLRANISRSNTPSKDIITFSLTVSNTGTVYFLSHWGTSSYYSYDSSENNPKYIKDGGSGYNITVDRSETVSAPSKLPETTSAPETTAFPQSTSVPKTTSAPEIIVSPETTVAPQITSSPETTAVPETAAILETTAIPETTMTPETAVTPESAETEQVSQLDEPETTG